jgi:8-oxo-dGTP diphosphatase
VDVKRRVYLIRHAHAGDRSQWQGDGSQRPLSEKGWRQAQGLAELLAGVPLERVLSSPSLRCVQTVEPLANAHGLKVETAEELLEGSDPRDTLDFLDRASREAGGPIAACTHGDIVPGVLDLLRSAGARVDGVLTWPKASTWVLEGADGKGFVGARYLPPP